MGRIYKILFTLILVFAFKFNIKALKYGGCDYTTVANLKSLINNINISYTYHIDNNEAYFDVTLNNIPNDVYFKDSKSNTKYEYSDAKNGEITIRGYNNIQSGQYKFYLDNGVCNNVKLGTKYYKFPIYNTRYQSDTCKKYSSYSLCKKWISKKYSDSEFEKKIKEYKESFENSEEIEPVEYEKSLISKIGDLYIEYYYYFLPLVIIVCLIIVLRTRRKNKFKL